MDSSATITIVRPFGLTGAIRKFHIICDGARVAKIANNSSETITLPAGRHSLQVKSDWLGAQPLIVTLKEGEHLRLICASADDFIQTTLATFCLPNSYLQLREMTESEARADAQSPSTERSPSWKTVAVYCGIWFCVVTLFAAILIISIVNTPGPEQVQEARMDMAGQISGFLFGGGCVAIVAFSYVKRMNSTRSR